MQLLTVPALKTNYIWLLALQGKQAIIIDPGVCEPVMQALEINQLSPTAILLTHHHDDHTAGVKALINAYPHLLVYGPQETMSKGASQLVCENTILNILGIKIHVMSVPGHTIGHVAYYLPQYHKPLLFCGDTLFSAGCGRLFEGSAKQMYHSLQKLTKLPNNTLIFCAHEYTIENLNFACYIDKKNEFLQNYRQKMQSLRSQNKPTLPTSLKIQKKVNLFLRCHELTVQKYIGFTQYSVQLWQVFAKLRSIKDHF